MTTASETATANDAGVAARSEPGSQAPRPGDPVTADSGSMAGQTADGPTVAAQPTAAEPVLIGRLRLLLLAIMVLAILGTGAELVLLEHMESRWQLVPLFVLGYGLVCAIAVAVRPSSFTVRFVRVVMAVFIVAGLTGLYLHYTGNAEFELEMYPSMEGLELFWESITGATPALAPGSMVQLGLLGLLFTYRHPALRGRSAQAKKEVIR